MHSTETHNLRVVRVPAPAPSPASLIRGSGSGDRPFALISGPGDADLSGWSYAALEPSGAASDIETAHREISAWSMARSDALPPFVGGAVGYTGYDGGWSLLPRPRPPRPDPLDMPPSRYHLYDAIYARSERTKEGFLIAQPTRDAERRLFHLRRVLFGGAPRRTIGEGGLEGALSPAITKSVHLARIRDALELIRAGQIYQVNLTYPLEGRYSGAPEAAFERLLLSPPPFAAILRTGADAWVISASPECFFDLDAASRTIAAYPIKGTRPRSEDLSRDRALAAELSRDEKERAEHLMIVDLLRNDLGRIAVMGTVEVRGLAYVESFPRVHHLTSRIVAHVPEALGLRAMMAAIFPGGSITGVPKLRAMEVIDALEARPRGVYTGAIGYVSPDGSARSSIAIRTAQIACGELRFGVGGGIVADSIPEREWTETEIKAQALSEALRAP